MKRILVAVLLAGTAACHNASTTGNATDANAAAAVQPAQGTDIGINLAAMDRQAKPGDDWYEYTNGGWMKSNEIPADRSSVGTFLTAFNETEKRNTQLIQDIVASNPQAGTDAARIANYYKAYTNTGAIDQAGMQPVQADLKRFMAIGDKQQLARVLGSQIRADVDPLNATNFQTENLFGIFVTQGLATPGKVLPYILQGGLGLPEREYYLSSDPKMVSIRKGYRAYIAKLLQTAGIDNADARAQAIYDLEMKIAGAHVSREDSENWQKSSTVWSRDQLMKNAPGLDWGNFLDAAQLGGQQEFAAFHAPAITRLAALVQSQPLDAWKDWLVFHQINAHADVLPTPIDQAHFAFYGTTLSGTPQQRPRDKRAIAAVNGALGDAVGKIYVQKYFPPAAKAEVQQMVSNIKAAFAKRVQAIDWMAPSTKQEALKKVENIDVGVGYPEHWRDYAQFDVSPTNAYANEVNAGEAEYRHQLAKIGKPLDRGEWWMTPQTVNAVNLPVQNALNFPAAILQPPFFDPKADAAFNYGAIGAVIGHEISHSFDNNGALFDSTGALRNWWTPADLQRFNQQGKALAQQYSSYKPFPDLSVNGALTLSENIADVAGLSAAYDAYHASLNGQTAPTLQGFTGDQRFFIAYGQSWATKMRPEALRARIATDGHAPGQYRALEVRNIDGWYQAFNVTPQDKLYLAPDKRVKIW